MDMQHSLHSKGKPHVVMQEGQSHLRHEVTHKACEVDGSRPNLNRAAVWSLVCTVLDPLEAAGTEQTVIRLLSVAQLIK